jgi:hypothetical protein
MFSAELSEEELQKAEEFAKAVAAKKMYSDIDRTENFFIGTLGEIAYAKRNGLDVNFDVIKNKGDGGVDFVDGAQVKTVTWGGNNKQLKVKKINENVSKYVLGYVHKLNPSNVYLIGEVSIANFKKKAQFIDKYGGVYVLDEKDLDVLY